MKTLKNTLLVIAMVCIGNMAIAQGGGGRMDPSQRVSKEKEAVLAKVTDLNEDQKLIFEQIYKEYKTSLTTLTEEARADGSREGMKEKMQEVRSAKNKAVKDLFTGAQFTLYKEATSDMRQGRGKGKKKKPSDSEPQN